MIIIIISAVRQLRETPTQHYYISVKSAHFIFLDFSFPALRLNIHRANNAIYTYNTTLTEYNNDEHKGGKRKGEQGKENGKGKKEKKGEKNREKGTVGKENRGVENGKGKRRRKWKGKEN